MRVAWWYDGKPTEEYPTVVDDLDARTGHPRSGVDARDDGHGRRRAVG